jgi:hypothetical protein
MRLDLAFAATGACRKNAAPAASKTRHPPPATATPALVELLHREGAQVVVSFP